MESKTIQLKMTKKVEALFFFTFAGIFGQNMFSEKIVVQLSPISPLKERQTVSSGDL